MRKTIHLFFFSLFLTSLVQASGVGSNDLPADVIRLTDSLKQVYAPDGRVALFQTDYTVSGRKMMLRGVTTAAAAKEAAARAWKGRLRGDGLYEGASR